MEFPLAPWLLLVMLAAAVFVVGVPRRPAPAGATSWWSIVVSHDSDLLVACGGLVGIATVASLAGVMGATGCMLLVTVVACVGLPVAINRYRRTNGDQAPHRILLAVVTAAAARAKNTPAAVNKLSVHLDKLPKGVRRKVREGLRRAGAPAAQRELLVALLASLVLRTTADGTFEWVLTTREAKKYRGHLFALACAHPKALKQALA